MRSEFEGLSVQVSLTADPIRLQAEIATVPDARAVFLADVLRGLSATPRSIPGKYLWDEEGSRLFEAIVGSAGYYQTGAEYALMGVALPAIAAILGSGAGIVEFGSGASRKIRQLLDALDAPARYLALDISRDFLEASAARIARDYPQVDVQAVCADYSRPLPFLPIERTRPVLGFLPGTSIGNMEPEGAMRLLAQLRTTLTPGFLLIGQDPNRDAALLRGAYEGPLMTAMHKNVLSRLELELGAEIESDAFAHESRTFVNRVEPHLVALRDTRIEIGSRTIAIAAGESIRTDVSWKYASEEFTALAVAAGWSVERRWDDPRRCFCLYLLRAH